MDLTEPSTRISVIGAGHVGLVTGACLAQAGHIVTMVENDSARLAGLRQSPPNVPIYEPGLQQLVEHLCLEAPERFRFTDSIREVVADSEAAFICVGTPQGETGEANLFYVERVATEIAEALVASGREHFVVIEKSTVPVRTGEAVRRTMERVLRRHGKDELPFEVVSNPEFLAEGTALRDFMSPDRIVVGVESTSGAEMMRRIYEPIIKSNADGKSEPEILITDVQSAELIKHASNSFLALRISFINAVANICERAGADIREVARGMGLDPRIGPHFLKAGVGFGGYCFPKDVAAFYHISKELGYPFELLKNVLEINEGQRILVIDKLRSALWNLKGKTIAIWGLAFKPNTEDMRGAPALDIIHLLQQEGALIVAYDPAVTNVIAEAVELKDSALAAAEGADAIVLVTEWKEFAELSDESLKSIATAMAYPVFIDGRNLLEPERMRNLGFEYHGIGVRRNT
ncbi:MAG: UDP-glucose/GDP-mannose dehydrogenase family protein [Planctomycetota bacterium]|nr:UDP-glucose/GDP-mannose dehydrogenase family protein [Planctomycetota bacterium]MDA1137843.1 UDP-glucose/GDP-mannose dehydrogenase family protein [Planctomycetota bacterium]